MGSNIWNTTPKQESGMLEVAAHLGPECGALTPKKPDYIVPSFSVGEVY